MREAQIYIKIMKQTYQITLSWREGGCLPSIGEVFTPSRGSVQISVPRLRRRYNTTGVSDRNGRLQPKVFILKLTLGHKSVGSSELQLINVAARRQGGEGIVD